MKDDNTGSARFASRALDLRRRRERLLGPDIFADPAWDMLLDLFVAHHRGREMHASGVGLAAGIPQTTALRWIAMLEDRGLVRREDDPRDARRVVLSLTTEALATLEGLLGDAAQDFRHSLSV